MEMFPFRIQATYNGHFPTSAPDFLDVFKKTRRPKTSWYAYDVEILSRTEVRFHVYGMEDTCFGGIGDLLYSYQVEVPRESTLKSIYKMAKVYAEMRRIDELQEAERQIIEKYTQEIMDGI